MSSADIQVAVSICAMLITISTAVWSWLTAGSRKNEKQIIALNDVISDQAKRVDKLENEIKNLPSTDAVHRMEISLEQMRGDMRVLTTSVEPMKELVAHINEILIENAKGRL